MKIFVLTSCFIFMSVISLFAQDLSVNPPQNWTSYLHLESGFIYPNGSIRDNFAIRQNISSFYVNQTTDGEVSSKTSGFVFGLRWEWFNKKLRTGVSTGLRFINYHSEIDGYSSSNSDFFYLRYSTENSDTRFARVNSIVETNNLINIPLEFRFTPVQTSALGLFVKAGAEISLVNLGKKTKINFQEASMKSYQDEVLNDIGIAGKKFYSAAYASAGMKFGRENKTNYTIEVFLPSIFLTKDNFNLLNVKYFAGFKFAVLIPYKKHK